jgi:hypothetical protein
MGTTSVFSKTAWELQRTSWGMFTDFHETLEKSFVAPKQFLDSWPTQWQEGLGKSMKILKHFAQIRNCLIDA